MQNIKQPKDPGPAAWNSILPAADPVEQLSETRTTDWLIIGAGFAGLAAARRLSQLDPTGQITLLEASRVAEGPAGRNSGFMIDLPHDLSSADYGGTIKKDRETITQNRLAIDFAEEMSTEFGLDTEAFSRSGKLNAAATDRGMSHNAKYARHLNALNEHHRLLDAQEMREITGSDFYQGGLFTPGTAILQPAKFMRGVASGIKRSNRIKLFEQSGVTALSKEGNAWRAETKHGSVSAPNVILAVNGHLNSFGYMANRLMHVFTYASMTRALTDTEIKKLGGQRVWGATPADPMGTTVRRISGQGGDRIVIRNQFTFDPKMEVSDKRLSFVATAHDRSFTARFPTLKHVAMEYRWGGRLCLSRNNVQVVGQLEDGLFSACCQNGLGTARGTLAGLAVAELSAGNPSSIVASFLDQVAPAGLPPRPLSWLGANAYMKWQEFRAGAEL